MSGYTFVGNEARYRIQVGVDPALGSLFAMVRDLASESPGLSREEAWEVDWPGEDMVLWLGGLAEPLLDLRAIVKAVSPYTTIPLAVQLQVIEDLALRRPLSPGWMGLQLAAICQQAINASLVLAEPVPQESYLWLKEDGNVVGAWKTLPQPTDEALAHLIDPSGVSQFTEEVSNRFSLPAMVVHVHSEGFTLGLPVLALTRAGSVFNGPLIVANDCAGLGLHDVHVLQQELVLVDPALRPHVTALWALAWRSFLLRGGQ